jgi:hypothetical protein
MVEQAFRESTIADLLTESTGSIPLVNLERNSAAATRAAEIAFPAGGTRRNRRSGKAVKK